MLEEDVIRKNLGLTVKELRSHKRLTQEQLAEYLELQPQTITAIETGKSFISCEVLARLSKVFEVNPSIFFTPKVKMYDEDELKYIHEIKQLLPLFNSEKLKTIYNILLVILNK